MISQKIANRIPSEHYNEQEAEMIALGFPVNTNNHWTHSMNNRDKGQTTYEAASDAGLWSFLNSRRPYENETAELELNERKDSMLFERFIPTAIVVSGLFYFLWWQ